MMKKSADIKISKAIEKRPKRNGDCSKGKLLINVCGAGHSGTTMLDLMLGNGPNAFSCGEVVALFRPFRKHHFKIDCSCGNERCEVWEKISRVREEWFHLKVLEEMEMKYVVDSSKNLAWVLDNNNWAARYGFGVRNVVIWKRPISLAYSFWKRGWGIRAGLRSFIKYHQRLLGSRLPFVAVNYNRLVADPAKELAKVCGSIGMEYFPGKENFWEETHHYLFGSTSIREQIRTGVPGIWHEENYQSEFLDEWELIEGRHRLWRTIDGLVAELEARDVERVSYKQMAERNDLGRRGAFRPVWYYWLRLWHTFRRHFPEAGESGQMAG